MQLFQRSFEVCSPDDKVKLKKLLQTWKTYPKGPIFSPLILNQLDQFVAMKTVVAAPINQQQQQPALAVIPSMNPTNMMLIQQIQKVLHQKKTAIMMNPLDSISHSHIQLLNQLLIHVQSNIMDTNTSMEIQCQLQEMMSTTTPIQMYNQPSQQILKSNFQPSDSRMITSTPLHSNVGSSNSAIGMTQMSPGSLVNNLVKFGLLAPPLEAAKTNGTGAYGSVQSMKDVAPISLTSDLSKYVLFFIH